MSRKRNNFNAMMPFTYETVPADFTPVTPEEMYEIREKYLQEAEENFGEKYAPAAAKQMIGSVISGEYDNMQSVIEGAYNSRRQQLHLAFEKAIQEADIQLMMLEKMFKEHETALSDYVELHRELSGTAISMELDIDVEKIKEIRAKIDGLKKREELSYGK